MLRIAIAIARHGQACPRGFPLGEPPVDVTKIAQEHTSTTTFLMPKKCLSKATKRTHNYPVRLSDLELDCLRIKAQDAGMSASELIRCLTLGKPLPKRLSKISLDTYIELGRIGNNLNQLTLSN